MILIKRTEHAEGQSNQLATKQQSLPTKSCQSNTGSRVTIKKGEIQGMLTETVIPMADRAQI